MVPSVALLCLLGAAALAGVGLASSVGEDVHVEEMVTRCIVEALLNGLSKPNAPPINPMCKELLQKSDRQKQEEKNVGKDIELNTKHLSESEEKPPVRTVGKEQYLNEEEFKRQAEEGEKRHSEEGKHGEIGNQQVLSQGNPYSYDEAHKEEKKNEEEKRNEQDNNYEKNYHNEEGSKAEKHAEEAEHELLDKKSPFPTGREDEGDSKHSGGQRHSEESVHNEEKRNRESKEEEGEEEQEEEESSEKYHHTVLQEYEDPSGRGKAGAEKRGSNPKHYHRKPQLANSFEYKQHYNGEKRDSPEESNEEESDFWDKRSYYPKHHYETRHHYEEKRNSDEMHSSEEMEEKSNSKEYRWYHSKEDDEEEDVRLHSKENEDKQHRYERKRFHNEPHKEMRHHYEERRTHGKTSDEEMGKQHGRRDEKRNWNDKERQHLQLEGETTKPQIRGREEEEEEEQRLYSAEEGPGGEKRHYPGASEEELEKRYQSEGGKHGGSKRTLLIEEGYPRNHYLVENVKRAATSFIPYYQQLRWRNRHTEKKDDITDQFWGSEEEPRSRLNERDLFSEYNNYDSREKKPFRDGLNHKHKRDNNLESTYKFDVKRQYNRMDELAHLLNYRKKSAEFPELYTPKEDVKRGHIIRSGEGKLSQRPLTPEEEKELENLAAMDLELQKIAEKFNNNWRG
ncbi:secretogranin-1 isoform X2 [Hemicordylus capensis]|uniref:secretogranin-1 isoform X2 n=1 Tax=Hemicordylus capensis TaxID=884348 RepID=UPI002303F7F6|nr:secretogranin-1 isoform X2 [Hemicordylus capensis]